MQCYTMSYTAQRHPPQHRQCNSTPDWQNPDLGQFVKHRNIPEIAFLAQRGSWRFSGSKNQHQVTIITEIALIMCVWARYIFCHDICHDIVCMMDSVTNLLLIVDIIIILIVHENLMHDIRVL